MPRQLFRHIEDERPPAGGWAPGTYLCKCEKCGDQFIGAKLSRQCSDCAYGTKPKIESR